MIRFDCEYNNYSKLFPYLLICLVVLIAYLPSFTGDFILDDKVLITNNPYFKEWHSISSYMFQEDGYDENTGKHTGYYRPLLALSYTLDYKIWGLCGPGYRITNLILHLLVCFSLLPFFDLIIRNKSVSLLLALVFSIHPVNTETVSWVAARNNILVTLFGIISLYYYIRYYRDKRFFAYILSLVFFILSIFSKELGIMLMPIFFLYHRVLNTEKAGLFVEIREYIPFVIIAFIYFILRQNTTGSLLTPLENADVLTRILNFPYVLILNLKMIFLPFQLHSFIIKYPEKFLNPKTLSSVFFICLIAYLTWRFRKNRILLFTGVSFLVAIFPVSGIINFPAPSLIAMRWLYFPLPLILFILARPLISLLSIKRFFTGVMFVCICFYLGVYSYMLNEYLWHTSDTFFKQEVQQFGNMFYADGYAIIYHKEKQYGLAKEYFKKNFDNGVNRGFNYLMYSEILVKEGNINESLTFLDKAAPYCSSDDELGMLFYIRGLAYLGLNDLTRARQNLEKSIIYSPKNSLYWENLGVAQGRVGNHESAITSFKKATKLGSESNNLYNNLVYAFISNNECNKALIIIERLLQKKRGDDIFVNRLKEDVKECLLKDKDILLEMGNVK